MQFTSEQCIRPFNYILHLSTWSYLFFCLTCFRPESMLSSHSAPVFHWVALFFSNVFPIFCPITSYTQGYTKCENSLSFTKQSQTTATKNEQSWINTKHNWAGLSHYRTQHDRIVRFFTAAMLLCCDRWYFQRITCVPKDPSRGPGWEVLCWSL